MTTTLSVLSGILLVLIFPRFDWTFLAPFALVPMLLACAWAPDWKRRALFGGAAGFVFWFGVCYWIQFVLEVHGGMGRWGGWGTFVLFAFLKGLHLAWFAALAGFLMPKPWAVPAVAALWTGIERTHGPFGFAWLDLGNAGVNMPVVMRLAPITGVYGLSFVFAMLNVAVALLILRRPRRELLPLAALVVLPFLPALPPQEQGDVAVRVVQPNVDTETDWTVEKLQELEKSMELLSRADKVDLTVWPEVPAPFYPSSAEFRAVVERVAKTAGTPLLFGGVARTEKGAPLNSAFFTDEQGKILDRYDKIKLVPFGEFVPPIFSFVNRITNEAGDFEAGDRVVVFRHGMHNIGAFICYESVFPDLVRQFTRSGAQVLLNLSNDGYFGTSAAREQHLALVRMRAAENGRWILRATNDGITALVDPAGRVMDTLPGYREIAGTMRYQYRDELTPYVRFGDWFAWGCLAAGMALAALGIWTSRNPAV